MKVAVKKRNEGRKAETKTSDKENESIQRKWLRGAARAKESPTAWCFLSSQRRGWEGEIGGQFANCPVPPSPPHLRPEAVEGFGMEASSYFLPVLLGHSSPLTGPQFSLCKVSITTLSS